MKVRYVDERFIRFVETLTPEEIHIVEHAFCNGPIGVVSLMALPEEKLDTLLRLTRAESH